MLFAGEVPPLMAHSAIRSVTNSGPLPTRRFIGSLHIWPPDLLILLIMQLGQLRQDSHT